MREKGTVLKAGLLIVLLTQMVSGQAGQNYVYVAPNAVQAQELGIFTTITLTNTTGYWFNPRIYLIDPNGGIIRQLTPLLKSFGTWQKASVDIIAEDFRGSVWIVSPQPIVSAAFIHQFRDDGSLSLLGNSKLEQIDSVQAEERLSTPE
jgi:hypothetical protein